MTTFLHSGKYGDCIFSLPTIKAMGGGVLYMPNKALGGWGVETMYNDMHSFMETQSCITEVKLYPDVLAWNDTPIPVDVNLNRHITHPLRGATNMVQRYFDVFGINQPVPLKWIEAETSEAGYTLVNITNRFRGKVNWHRVINSIKGELMFVGTDAEWGEYKALGTRQTIRAHCPDVLTLCSLVAHADAVYCNQSLVLALAIAMDKKRYVEFKPLKTNCKFYTPNEYELL